MNIPWQYAIFGVLNTRKSIADQLDKIAIERGLTPYSEKDTLYRLKDWGLVGIRLACNVIYFQPDGSQLDLGRIVA
jgi:hypothetical protein